MFRLGLRLTLNSGREALVRLALTTVAVAVGVALLLGVLAEFHAFQAQSNQACWACTGGNPNVPSPLPANGELWNNSVDFYAGQTITRLDVAALGKNEPMLPGVATLPAPGTYYASPALAALIRSVPADQLGDRFPGRMVGTIGQAALTGPGELAIYIGYTPAAVNAINGTVWVTSIATAPAPEVFTPFFRYAFAVGLLAVLFPMLVLISTATRLAASRREERFAALRLVGGTPADIRSIAAVEAAVSAFFGAVLGAVIWLALQPLVAGGALIGTRYFASTVTPAVWAYPAVIIGVPVVALVAALISLRRVQISPLGVSRRAAPKRPSAARLVVLAIGVALYFYGLTKTSHQSIGAPVFPGLLLTMIGLVIAGPWFTWATARLFGSMSPGAAPLLASRRLADNPKAAFRSVTGLVLAVFLGTIVGTLVPAVNATESSPTSTALSNVLLDQVGMSPAHGARLVAGLSAIGGTDVYPFYLASPGSKPEAGLYGGQGGGFGPLTVVSCAVMRDLAVLGQCAPGLSAVQTNDGSMFGDNPLYNTQAFVTASDPAYHGSLAGLPLQAVLVRVDSAATLERVRTYLAVHAPPQIAQGPGSSPTPPRTFGETLGIRLGRAATLEDLVYAAVALTLIVAGCSLAVAVGGGLVERKRPFTLLRVGGTGIGVLSAVVLIEAAVPLVAATLLAAAIAYWTSVLAYVKLAPANSAIPQLGHSYYDLMAAGLVIAFAIIAVTLPLLRRMTTPGNVRFE